MKNNNSLEELINTYVTVEHELWKKLKLFFGYVVDLRQFKWFIHEDEIVWSLNDDFKDGSETYSETFLLPIRKTMMEGLTIIKDAEGSIYICSEGREHLDEEDIKQWINKYHK
jgi:hypothetical protein